MARTQAADYDQRREQIVERAARLYAKSGFLGASVSDLAEACNLSKSAIYHYYPSKEDILFDVMHSHVTALERAANDAMEAGASAEARLRALARSFMGLYAGAVDRHKVLLNELDQLPKPRRAEIVAVQRRLIATVESLFVEIAPGIARRERGARATAMLFFGMINWTHTWFNPNGPIDADALAEMAVSTILRGVDAA